LKGKQHLLIKMLLLLLLVLLPEMGRTDSPLPVQHKAGEWKGNISNQKDEFIKIVETQTEWDELWLRAFEKPAPDLDFEKKVVACVFLGYSADWLYSIHIDEPVRRDKAWVIPYGLAEIILELSGPFKASGQYAMKILEKRKDASMILEEDTPSRR
jgi:hypothetical protein